MGVVHHAAYLPWLEEARVAMLRDAGHPYTQVRADGLDLAVIETHVRYLLAARFEDAIVIHLRIGAVRGSTFQIAYLLLRDVETISTAVTVHACLDRESGRPRRAPAWLHELAAGETGTLVGT